MEAGEVTEFAKKKIEQANHKEAASILAQVKNEVATLAGKHKHDKEADLHKQLADSVQGLVKLNDKETAKKESHHHHADSKTAPANAALVKEGQVGPNEFLVHAPIDEVEPIAVKLAPTFGRDTVLSAHVGAFRKVVGYDTFDSILKQGRDEIKDPNDYYNVSINMMIQRSPTGGAAKVLDQWNGGQLIAPKLDKGFPYDDGDSTISDKVKGPHKSGDRGQAAGKLNGENITTGDLKNLVVDKAVPLTESTLVLLEGDGDNVFKLMDENVTKGQMKNLITDKPAPITVKLAQTSGDGDNVFKLMDENVTKGQMKNLITDKPAPITVKLAQTNGDSDNVFQLMDSNVTKGQMKNLITDKPAPITVKLAQVSNPVVNPPFNNWSVNQPTVAHAQGGVEADLGLRNLIIEGVNGYDFVQTEAQNPVVNPPFNNWSVNQPSVPHDSGLAGDADLGHDIVVDGHAVHFAQKIGRAHV